MKFTDIFKDSNEYNEKSIIGFLSFAIMTLTILLDIITGLLGYELTLNQFVYDSFVYVTIGSLGVAGIEKFATRRNTENTNSNTEESAP